MVIEPKSDFISFSPDFPDIPFAAESIDSFEVVDKSNDILEFSNGGAANEGIEVYGDKNNFYITASSGNMVFAMEGGAVTIDEMTSAHLSNLAALYESERAEVMESNNEPQSQLDSLLESQSQPQTTQTHSEIREAQWQDFVERMEARNAPFDQKAAQSQLIQVAEDLSNKAGISTEELLFQSAQVQNPELTEMLDFFAQEAQQTRVNPMELDGQDALTEHKDQLESTNEVDRSPQENETLLKEKEYMVVQSVLDSYAMEHPDEFAEIMAGKDMSVEEAESLFQDFGLDAHQYGDEPELEDDDELEN